MTRAAARGLSQLNESCPAEMAETDATMGYRLLYTLTVVA